MSTKSLRDSFGLRFFIMARRWQRALDGHLAMAGMTDATWRPLVHLQENGDGITQKALSALVGVDSSSLVRVLDILEREGLIERRRDETDSRANLLYLTPAGHEREQQIRNRLRDAQAITLANLSDQDLESLMVSLEALNHGLCDLEQVAGRACAKTERGGEGEES